MILRKMGAIARRSAGARDARLRVDHDVLRVIEQPGFRERHEREECRRWIAARIGHERGIAHVVPEYSVKPYVAPAGSALVAGYHWERAASSRILNAPDRSITRTPAVTSGGASSAAALSGTARNATSTSEARRAGLSGSTWPSQILASRGSGRAAESALDDIAISSRTCGCRDSSAKSS